MSRPSFAPFVGAVADAWAELRVHKLRVLLSLIGITVSVAVLTAVVALGEYQRQSMVEQSDRWGGRVATVQISASPTGASPIDWDGMDEQFDLVSPRYGFEHSGRFVQGLTALVDTPQGFAQTPLSLVDPAYAIIHRQEAAEGRTLRAADAEILAPAVMVTWPLWDKLGQPDLDHHPTLTLGGNIAGTYQIVGVTPRQGEWDQEILVTMLYDAYRSQVDVMPVEASVTREVWVGAEIVNEIGPALAADMRSGIPEGINLQVHRSDWASQPGSEESIRMTQLITGGIAALVLALGALSLVNIQLVAMRQRIREIGVRRAFGATGMRIFSTVVLESLVATTVAGIIGIALTVAILRGGLIQLMFQGMQDVPPFPFNAAVVGLIASVVVGALSGLIPALVAIRVKVIDAIRF